MSARSRILTGGALGCVLLAGSACQEVAGVDFERARLSPTATPTGPGSKTGSGLDDCDKSCADLGFACGPQFDTCGRPKDCGACPSGQTCEAGKCTCTKKSCAELGMQCGTQSDGCGGAVECGKCANPDEACVDGKCKCQPRSCLVQNAQCGNVPDGCGSQYACGTCETDAPNCGGAGPNKCGTVACVPKSCAEQGKNCGTVSDGCGAILDCGQCTGPATCAGGGVANVCGCTPTTCAAQGKNCGAIPDGCGGTLDCGACAAPNSCQGGGVANVCGCTSNGSCDECCGSGADNCGRPCTRSTCCGGGGGCFAAGTLVRLADGTTKPIEQIRAGDSVASFDRATKSVVIARVLAPLVHGPETSAGGFVVLHGPQGALRVTPNHPLLVDGAAKRADAFRAGNRVLLPGVARNTPASLPADVLDIATYTQTIGLVERIEGRGESTYDLAVDGPGTFFANGIVVLRKQIP